MISSICLSAGKAISYERLYRVIEPATRSGSEAISKKRKLMFHALLVSTCFQNFDDMAQGSEIELTGYALRALLTEGLWHAAISNSGNAS